MLRLGRLDRFTALGRLRAPVLPTAPRAVVCYLCARPFESDGSRIAEPCPHCHRPVHAADILVEGPRWTDALRTCGRLLVTRNAHLTANEAVASAGIEILGSVDAALVTGGLLTLGPHARLRGPARAAALAVAPGAVLLGGPVCVPGPLIDEPGQAQPHAQPHATPSTPSPPEPWHLAEPKALRAPAPARPAA